MSDLRQRKPKQKRGGLRPNSKRIKEKHARNFGAEADAVRGMPCLVAIVDNRTPCSGQEIVYGDEIELGSEPAHIISRGASGGRFDIIPLCAHHHAEQHQHGVKTFAAKYGLDLRAEADRVALEHERPLGIQGLADRWLASTHPWPCAPASPPLDTYETDALRGWLVRRMAIDFATLDNTTHADRDGLVELIEAALDIEDAWALCEWAGWPS